jgi:hypothetical protein
MHLLKVIPIFLFFDYGRMSISTAEAFETGSEDTNSIERPRSSLHVSLTITLAFYRFDIIRALLIDENVGKTISAARGELNRK